MSKIELLKTINRCNTPFMFLNELFREPLLITNEENLEYLVTLLHNIVKKALNNKEHLSFKFQMDAERVSSLCSILSRSDDQVMKKLSYIISVFCYERENLDLFIQEL